MLLLITFLEYKGSNSSYFLYGRWSTLSSCQTNLMVFLQSKKSSNNWLIIKQTHRVSQVHNFQNPVHKLLCSITVNFILSLYYFKMQQKLSWLLIRNNILLCSVIKIMSLNLLFNIELRMNFYFYDFLFFFFTLSILLGILSILF